MSSGGGNTTTTTQSLPPWATNAAQGFLSQAQGVAQLPYTPYDGPQVAGLSPMQQYGMQGLGNMAGGTDYTNAAGNMLTETLQGGGMNPYLDQVAGRALNAANRNYQDQTGAVTARFNRPGNFLGSAHEAAQSRTNEDFARGSTDALGQIFAGGYQNERGNQLQAASLANSLFGGQQQGYQNAINAGGLDQQTQQRLYDAQRSNFNEWRDYPEHQLGVYGNALGAITGAAPRTSTQSGPGPDPFSQGLGAIMLGNSLRGSGTSGSKS